MSKTDNILLHKRQEDFVGLLKQVANSITFIEFAAQPEGVSNVYSGKVPTKEIGLFDARNAPYSERVEWLINILKQYQVKGEFLFSFDTLPFVRVNFKNDAWIETLWKNGNAVDFIPADLSYLLLVNWTESCTGDNCYIARIAHTSVR